MGNGIIFGVAMTEKKLESDEVRHSVVYPMGAERKAKRNFRPLGPVKMEVSKMNRKIDEKS